MIFSSPVPTLRSCLLTHGLSSAMSRLWLLMQTNTPQSRHQRHVVLRVDREGDFVTRGLSSGMWRSPVFSSLSFLFVFFLKLLPVCLVFLNISSCFSRYFHSDEFVEIVFASFLYSNASVCFRCVYKTRIPMLLFLVHLSVSYAHSPFQLPLCPRFVLLLLIVLLRKNSIQSSSSSRSFFSL